MMSDLQGMLDAHAGGHRPIRAVTQQPCQYTSSFRIDELDVQFEDGATMRLVLKDMSRDQMVEGARRRPDFLYGPQREINAYRWLLPAAPAGTATFHGSMLDQHQERFWLVLERVDGAPLWQVGDITVWEEAAAWIARLHRSFPPEDARHMAARLGAIVCDDAWYWRWLERARRFAGDHPEKRRVLDGVERVFARVVDRLTSRPQVMIHGEFYPSNVISRTRDTDRICPVDWEMTTLGPGLIDLAALTAGWAESTQRALALAYVAAADGMPVEPSVQLPEDFVSDLDCCRLYLAVRMLGWSGQWEPPRDHAHDWLTDAQQLTARVEAFA